jgi:hypothetical protein
MTSLQGYIDASYERLVERLGDPNIFYEFKFKAYDICGEEFDITIVSQYDGVWQVFAKDPCAMQIVQNKIDPIYCEIITEKK